MKVFRWLNVILMASVLAACSQTTIGVPQLFSTPTSLPQAQPTIIHAPDAQAAVKAFLEALKNGDFTTMYSMLTKSSQDSIKLEDFSARYNDALNNMSASS